MDFEMLTNVKGYCFPAFIYAMLVAYTIIFTLAIDMKDKNGKQIETKEKLLLVLFEIIWGIIILYVLLLLCKKGYEEYAWVLLLLPIVLNLIFYKK